MDTSDRQRVSALPSIKMLDLEKIKREEADYQARSTNMPPSTVSSPTHQYPSGPPPPYSHPSFSGARTPPETRRSSGAGEDASKQAPKQSLPSIHEALGVDQPMSYSSQSSYSAAPHSTYQATAPASPPPSRRSFAMEPPPPPPQHSAPASHGPRSPYSQPRREISPRPMAEPAVERRGPVYAAQPPPPSPLQHQSQYPRSYPPPTHSPTHERAPSHQVPVSMAPPPTNFPYGYAPYPAPHYAPYGPPPPAPASSSIYQPSITQPAPSHPEPAYRHGVEPARFGESVKRHLDMWDFGEALNEVAEASNYALEFSRQCGARLHQTQRSDPVPGTLPQVHEIDHLMEKNRRQMECYVKMREFIIAQQTAYFQQAQEQQYRAQDVMKRDSVHQVEDSKGDGFAGTEAKKRRGRAAPPGRCHSCNRAETPEWRRGPDGARTLCNACGLHYAKLTRKAGKNAASIGSSNLRPKAADDTQG